MPSTGFQSVGHSGKGKGVGVGWGTKAIDKMDIPVKLRVRVMGLVPIRYVYAQRSGPHEWRQRRVKALRRC
jgi:hypothetical protein